MSKLLKMLKENNLTLIVELPENTVEFAQAAEKNGADAIIIREGYGEEETILNSVSIPVGVDLNKKKSEESKKLMELDFDFVNFHPEVIEGYLNKEKTKIVALDESFTLDKLMHMMDEKIDAIDAAIIPPNQLGKELIVGDLQNYIAIAMSSNIPVMVPTQRSIKPSEIPIIWDTGAKGLILTKVVLGDNIKSFTKAVSEYRIAVDDIDTGK